MVTIADPLAFLLVFGFVALYTLITVNYLALHSVAIADLYRHTSNTDEGEAVGPGVGIIVPAYNEAETILDSLPSFLNLAYPDTEIVVVNDGSSDETLAKLREAYDLREQETVPTDIPCEPIRAVYEATGSAPLRVVDKENGGKATR